MSTRGPLATLSLITMAFWSWLLVVLQFLLSGCVCPNITSWRMWELIVVSHFFSNNCNCPPVPLLDVISDGDRRLLIKEKRSMTCLCTSFSQHVFSGSLGFFRLVWSHFYLESLEKQLKRRARAQLFYLSTFECNCDQITSRKAKIFVPTKQHWRVISRSNAFPPFLNTLTVFGSMFTESTNHRPVVFYVGYLLQCFPV